MRTNSIQQTAEELVTCAKTRGKNTQSKLNKAQSKRNEKPYAKKETMAAHAEPGTSSQPTRGGPANRPRTKYSFEEDLVELLFEMLYQAKKLKLPEPRNQEDLDKFDDPQYCAYHRGLGHPTKSCWVLKDKLQTLVDAGFLRLKTERDTATAIMTPFMPSGHPPSDSSALIPISVAEIQIVNSGERSNRTPRGGGPPPRRNQDPHAKKETLAADTQQASSPIPTGGGFIDRSRVKYSFKDDKVEALFKVLSKGNQLKLPEPRNPEDVGKTDDPRYCLYHRGLGHPTKNCWSLKGKLQSLIDTGALRLKAEYKTATASMTTCLRFGQSPPTPTAVYPIPVVEVRIVKSDPHYQQEKRLVSTPFSGGETICMHPDLLDDLR